MKLTTLNEQPQITFSTKEGLWKHLQELIEVNHLELKFFDKTDNPDIYRYDGVHASLYIHYTKKDGITAYMCFKQNAINHKGKIYPVIQQKETLNYKNIFNNFTLTIFKDMNKHYKRPVLTDDKNSEDMQYVFNAWLDNTDKVGLKNFFIYDAKTKKTLYDTTELEHDVWDRDLSGRRYTLVFDFYDYLKESEPLDNIKLNPKLRYNGPRKTPPEVTFF